MARYRGRHRAPSTTGRAIARTAIAGAVVGAPLVVITPAADAAPDTTWDRVAQCESTGNWSINTGNGFSGGLQFTPSTWRAFGGTQFAPNAFQASRSQQIVVAEKVLAGQGWGAWPVCSQKAGATGQAATIRGVPAAPRLDLSAPRPAAPRPAASRPAAAPTAGSYVVERGDTLFQIAARNHVGGGWKTLVAKNPGLAGNPGKIMPGQRITL